MTQTLDEAANPYMFLVGCPRSGTTLLQRMLDAHPSLAVANDTHFITRAAKTALRHADNPSLTQELLDAVLKYKRFYRMGLEEREVRETAARCKDYAEFVSRLYTLRAKGLGKTLSGEKTPDYCRQVPALAKLFPAAKFVHILRDGRDVALSLADWANKGKGPGRWASWEWDKLGTCALSWRWQVLQGRRDGDASAASRYYELHYESLVSDPKNTLRNLAKFLRLNNVASMVNYHVGRTRSKPGLSPKSAWLPATSGLRDWRTQMQREDVEVFEELAADALEVFGYERASEGPTPEAKSRARKLKRWWQSQKMARALGEYEGD